MEQQLSPFECAISEVMARFEEEMNAKNEAYLYIIQKGLFDDYCNYTREQQQSNEKVHERCVAELYRRYCAGNAGQLTPQQQNTKKKKSRAMGK